MSQEPGGPSYVQIGNNNNGSNKNDLTILTKRETKRLGSQTNSSVVLRDSGVENHLEMKA